MTESLECHERDIGELGFRNQRDERFIQQSRHEVMVTWVRTLMAEANWRGIGAFLHLGCFWFLKLVYNDYDDIY